MLLRVLAFNVRAHVHHKAAITIASRFRLGVNRRIAKRLRTFDAEIFGYIEKKDRVTHLNASVDCNGLPGHGRVMGKRDTTT